MVPVRKFSMRTSDDLTSVLTTSTASGALRSSVMPRLLRLKSRYAAASPSLCGVQVRDSSPAPVSSTLMTSAPKSARRAPHQGPAMTRERSTTRMPSSASGKVAMPVTIPCPVLHSTGSNLSGRSRRIAMKRAWIGILVAALLCVAGSTGAQDNTSGTVTIESKSVALGVGVSWGDGTLQYDGKAYKFSLKGLSVLDIGVSKVSARGKVFNLKKAEDFAGTYAAAQAGAAVGGGMSAMTLR